MTLMRHESAEIMGVTGGAMASAYRKEIGRRVRRVRNIVEAIATGMLKASTALAGRLAATEAEIRSN
jgi:hypothetical protein